eukprot:scaffold38702_cov37-Prasinocladus_malaysianus.AAC.2
MFIWHLACCRAQGPEQAAEGGPSGRAEEPDDGLFQGSLRDLEPHGHKDGQRRQVNVQMEKKAEKSLQQPPLERAAVHQPHSRQRRLD